MPHGKTTDRGYIMRRLGNFRGTLSGVVGLIGILTLAGCDSLMADSDDQAPMAEQTPPDSSQSDSNQSDSSQTAPEPNAAEPTPLTAPAAMPETTAAPAAMPETTAPAKETVVQSMPTDHRTIYLASYRTEKRALKGFHELQGKSQGLKDAQPVYKTVDIPHKGHFVRLFADVNTPAMADQTCNDLIKLLPDCGSSKR